MRTKGFTLPELAAAIRESWSAETADHPDEWSPDNPARCQCGSTALLIRELLGGEILLADVLRDGAVVERHAWNRLVPGVEIDLTAEQFPSDVSLGPPTVGEPMVRAVRPDAYELLKARALGHLRAD
jgi:hypothetical protein